MPYWSRLKAPLRAGLLPLFPPGHKPCLPFSFPLHHWRCGHLSAGMHAFSILVTGTGLTPCPRPAAEVWSTKGYRQSWMGTRLQVGEQEAILGLARRIRDPVLLELNEQDGRLETSKGRAGLRMKPPQKNSPSVRQNERHRVGFPQWLRGKESTSQDRRDGFDPCFRKIPHALGQLSTVSPGAGARQHKSRHCNLREALSRHN